MVASGVSTSQKKAENVGSWHHPLPGYFNHLSFAREALSKVRHFEPSASSKFITGHHRLCTDLVCIPTNFEFLPSFAGSVHLSSNTKEPLRKHRTLNLSTNTYHCTEEDVCIWMISITWAIPCLPLFAAITS